MRSSADSPRLSRRPSVPKASTCTRPRRASLQARPAFPTAGKELPSWTAGSGWLSDRYDKRVLLAAYYGLRGLSLLFLPYADNLTKLALFGIVYGLDWIATVPPTVGLASDLFGKRSGPILFGWIFFGHQAGAALAAYGGGLLRVWFGTYQVAFTTAGLLALGAAILVLTIRQGRRPVLMASTHQTSPTGTPGTVAAMFSPPRAR